MGFSELLDVTLNLTKLKTGGQDSLVGKALGSQAERYWVRFSLRPLMALNMSD
jgi:hypothetical protein